MSWFTALPPAPIQSLSLAVFTEARLDVRVLRDDLRSTILSGNKARKLEHNLRAAVERGARTLVSMGGPHSNHLLALAEAGALFGLATAAFIRTDPGTPLTPTLRDCQAAGMQLMRLSRQQFRALRAERLPDLSAFPAPYWLPEGGSNALAVTGLVETLQQPAVAEFAPDIVFTAAGTGATAAAFSAGLAQVQAHGEIWAVAVVKGGGFLLRDGKALLDEAGYHHRRPLRMLTGFHFGGYGRCPAVLQQFCRDFHRETGLPVEPIYTGRVCYALQQMAQQGIFRRGCRILLVHTGGMQGARASLADRP